MENCKEKGRSLRQNREHNLYVGTKKSRQQKRELFEIFGKISKILIEKLDAEDGEKYGKVIEELRKHNKTLKTKLN